MKHFVHIREILIRTDGISVVKLAGHSETVASVKTDDTTLLPLRRCWNGCHSTVGILFIFCFFLNDHSVNLLRQHFFGFGLRGLSVKTSSVGIVILFESPVLIRWIFWSETCYYYGITDEGVCFNRCPWVITISQSLSCCNGRSNEK